jgi:hypothetical protein
MNAAFGDGYYDAGILYIYTTLHCMHAHTHHSLHTVTANVTYAEYTLKYIHDKYTYKHIAYRLMPL